MVIDNGMFITLQVEYVSSIGGWQRCHQCLLSAKSLRYRTSLADIKVRHLCCGNGDERLMDYQRTER